PLNCDRCNKQWQIIRTHAEVQIAHRRFKIGPIGHFVRDDTELRANRIGHFLADHRDCDWYRMAGSQRSDDDVDRIRKLRAKFFLAAAAHEFQCQRRQDNAADKTDKHRLGERAVKKQYGCEHAHHSKQDEEDQTAKTDGKPRLQEQLIEIDNWHSVVPTAGQTALTPQLHEHTFTVCLVRHHLEAAIDLFAVGRIAIDQQIYALGKHRGREADENVEQIDRIEISHDRSELLRGIEKAAGNIDSQIRKL